MFVVVHERKRTPAHRNPLQHTGYCGLPVQAPGARPTGFWNERRITPTRDDIRNRFVRLERRTTSPEPRSMRRRNFCRAGQAQEQGTLRRRRGSAVAGAIAGLRRALRLRQQAVDSHSTGKTGKTLDEGEAVVRTASGSRNSGGLRRDPRLPSAARPVKPSARKAAPAETCGRDVGGSRLQTVSNSNPTMLRSSRPNSTPIRWTGTPGRRYLSA